MSRKISPNNPVRRRIVFSDEDNVGEAITENSQNILQERFAREEEIKKKKWHYDFKNDVPLPGEGRVSWRENERGDLIGTINDESEEDEGVKSDIENMREENENTPNATPLKTDPPPVRKRSRDGDAEDNPKDSSAKRSLELVA